MEASGGDQKESYTVHGTQRGATLHKNLVGLWCVADGGTPEIIDMAGTVKGIQGEVALTVPKLSLLPAFKKQLQALITSVWPQHVTRFQTTVHFV